MSDVEEALVTVTGASGFIALHVVRRLLDAGYRVRGTIRSRSKEPALREALARHTPHATTDRLSYVEADLLQDEGWAEAVAGARFVHHIASPLPSEPPRHEDDLIIPADKDVSMLDVAKILHEEYRERGYKVPTRRLPSFVLRLVALFDKTARLAVPELGLRQDVSHQRASQVLGYEPRPIRESVLDMAESFVEHGIV